MDVRYIMIDSSYRDRLLYPNPADYILPHQLNSGTNSLDSYNPTTRAYPVYNFRWNSTSFVFPANYNSPSYHPNFIPPGGSTPQGYKQVLTIAGGAPQGPILSEKIQELIQLSGYPIVANDTTSPSNSSSTTITQAKNMLQQCILVGVVTISTLFLPMTVTGGTTLTISLTDQDRKEYSQYLIDNNNPQVFQITQYDPSLKLTILSSSMSSLFAIQKPVVITNLPYTPDFQPSFINSVYILGTLSPTSTPPTWDMVSENKSPLLSTLTSTTTIPSPNTLYPIFRQTIPSTTPTPYSFLTQWDLLYDTATQQVPDTINAGYWTFNFVSVKTTTRDVIFFIKPFLWIDSIQNPNVSKLFSFDTNSDSTCEQIKIVKNTTQANVSVRCYLPTTNLYTVLYAKNLEILKQPAGDKTLIPYSLDKIQLGFTLYAYTEESGTVPVPGEVNVTFCDVSSIEKPLYSTVTSTVLQIPKVPSNPLEILLMGYDLDLFTNFNVLTLLVGQESSNDGFRINSSTPLFVWDLTKNVICAADLVVNSLRLPLLDEFPNRNQIPNYLPNDMLMVFTNEAPQIYGDLSRFGNYLWNQASLLYQSTWIPSTNIRPLSLSVQDGNYTSVSLQKQIQPLWSTIISNAGVTNPLLTNFSFYGIFWKSTSREFWWYQGASPFGSTPPIPPTITLTKKDEMLWSLLGFSPTSTSLTFSFQGTATTGDVIFLPVTQTIPPSTIIPGTVPMIFPWKATKQNQTITFRIPTPTSPVYSYVIPENTQFNTPEELSIYINSGGPIPSDTSTTLPFPKDNVFLTFTNITYLDPDTLSIVATPIVFFTSSLNPISALPTATDAYGNFFLSLGVTPGTRRRTTLIRSSLSTPLSPYVRNYSIGSWTVLSSSSILFPYTAGTICQLIVPTSNVGSAYVQIDQVSTEGHILSYTLLDPGYDYPCCGTSPVEVWLVPIFPNPVDLTKYQDLFQSFSSSTSSSSSSSSRTLFATWSITSWKTIVKMNMSSPSFSPSSINISSFRGEFLYLHAASGEWTTDRYNYRTGDDETSSTLYLSSNRSVPRPTPDRRTFPNLSSPAFTLEDAFGLYGTVPIYASFSYERYQSNTVLIQIQNVAPTIIRSLLQLGNVSEILCQTSTVLQADVCTATRCAVLPFLRDTATQLNYTGSTVSSTQMVCYNIRVASLVIPNQDLDLASGGLTSSYPYMFVEWANESASSAHNRYLMYSNNPNAIFATFTCPISDVNAPTTTKFIKIFSAGSQSLKFLPNDNLKFRVFMPDGQTFTTLFRDYLPPLPPNPFLQLSCLFELNRLA